MKHTGTFTACKVVTIEKLNAATSRIVFDRDVDAQPGQFLMAWLPSLGEKPFSLFTRSPLSIVVVDVGPFSHALQTLRIGDSVWIKGSLGNGFTPEGENVLMVGGGYGAAPLYSLAKACREQLMHVIVCLGAGTSSSVLLRDEFDRLDCQVAVATEDGSAGTKGLVTNVVEDVLRREHIDTIYACGPTGMLTALAKISHKHKINYQFSWEAHMRCGMGLCGSCEVSPDADPSLPAGWLACFDGPVFRKHWNAVY